MPYCQLDSQGIIIACSPKAERLLGYSLSDLCGQHVSLLCNTKEHAPGEIDALLEHAVEAGEIIFEINADERQQRPLDLDVTCSPLRDDNGELQGFLLLISDISRHKQTERALRQRKALFSSTFYQAAVGMVLVQMTDAKFVGANKTMCDMLDYTEEEFCTKTIIDVTHPDDVFLDLDNTKRMIDGEITMFTIEKRLLRKDGTPIWTRLTAASVSRDEMGHAQYGMAVVEDITQIKAAEEALKESEERFKMLADSAPVLIFMTDPQGKYLYVNKSYLNYTGLTYANLLGTHWMSIIHPLDRDTYLDILFQAFEKQEPFRIELRMQRCDGEYGWVLSSGVPRYTPNGLFIGFIGTGIDITDKKLLEETLEKAKSQAEDLNRKKSEFLSVMSHELRTPLNSIIGYSRMIENNMAGPLTANQSKFIQNVVYSGKHLLNLVNDLLDLSKIEAGKMKINPVVFELAPLMEEVRTMLLELANKRNIALIFDIQPDITTIKADPERLKQIFINLINNAIKFNHAGGRVRVKLYLINSNEWLLAQVQDTGIGIPEDKLQNLFSKFYQVDTSASRSNEGTGLGLALTKELIELHGGKIEITSKEDIGTTFTFKIPITDSKLNKVVEVEKGINYETATYSSR